MINKVVLISIVVFLFFSCKKEKKNIDEFTGTQIKIEKGSEILANKDIDKIISPYEMYYIDSCIILRDPDNFYDFKLVDLRNTDSVYRFGQKGQGPNELSHSFQLMKNGENSRRVNVLDFERQNINTFSIDSIIQGKTISDSYFSVKSGKEMFYRMFEFSKGKYICTGSSQSKMFCFYDAEKDSSYWQIDYPQIDEEIIPKEILPIIYQGDYKMNEQTNRLVFACTNTPFIGFYENNNGIVKVLSQKRYAFLDIKPVVSESHTTYDPNSETHTGFVAVQIVKDFVFALYAGRKQGDYKGEASFYGRNIYVYDFEGNSLADILLPEDLSGFCVSDDFRTIYGIERRENVEISLVKYDLDITKFEIERK